MMWHATETEDVWEKRKKRCADREPAPQHKPHRNCFLPQHWDTLTHTHIHIHQQHCCACRAAGAPMHRALTMGTGLSAFLSILYTQVNCAQLDATSSHSLTAVDYGLYGCRSSTRHHTRISSHYMACSYPPLHRAEMGSWLPPQPTAAL